MADIYRLRKVHVMGKKCDACAFSPNRIIPGARVADIVRETKDTDGASFICHKTTLAGTGDAVCRAWYDQFADGDPTFVMAERMGVIEFVEEPTHG
jgi:hypothetical protein